MILEASFFGESPFGVEFADELESTLTHSELAALQRSCFAIVKPDAVLSGRAQAVIDSFIAAGFNLRHTSLLDQPHEWQFEELYKFNLTLYNSQNQIGAWWINRRIYTHGPSIKLLFRLPGDTSPAGLASRLKGPSSPYLGSCGQIRRDLGATNRALNLVHTSDGPISSAREFLIFNSLDDLRLALSEIPPLPATSAPIPAVDGGSHDFSFFSTIQEVKSRLADKVFANNEDSRSALAASYDAASSPSSPEEEVNLLRRLSRGELQLSGNITETPEVRLFRTLADPVGFGPPTAKGLPEMLSSARLPVSETELLVLQSSIFYFDEDAAQIDG